MLRIPTRTGGIVSKLTLTPEAEEVAAVAPLEQLFLLEVEYHRHLRTETPGTPDPGGLHTSYALQNGYEGLIRAVGAATGKDVEAVKHRHGLAGDPREKSGLPAARESSSRARFSSRPEASPCRPAPTAARIDSASPG